MRQKLWKILIRITSDRKRMKLSGHVIVVYTRLNVQRIFALPWWLTQPGYKIFSHTDETISLITDSGGSL